MPDPIHTELRQIKRILLGILACLVVIALALAPVLIHIALTIGVLYALYLVVSAYSPAAQSKISQLWFEISSFWRRQRRSH